MPHKMNNLRLRTNIKTLRFLNNELTQQELADRIGACRKTIGHLERGNYNLSLKLAYDITNIFQKHIDEVFYYEKGLVRKAEQSQ